MPMVIKRIGPVSCAKIAGMVYAIMGLIIGGIVSLLALAGGLISNAARAGGGGLASSSGIGAGAGAMIGAGAIVFFPILYGCMGFVLTLIGAWLYNVVSGLVGGIEMDVE
jgi:Transmembrane domain of unknown function (DUF3566)